jgi:hypothetical protein
MTEHGTRVICNSETCSPYVYVCMVFLGMYIGVAVKTASYGLSSWELYHIPDQTFEMLLIGFDV